MNIIFRMNHESFVAYTSHFDNFTQVQLNTIYNQGHICILNSAS